MGCTVRGKGNERVEEATRVVWVDQTVVVVMMWMEVRKEAREEW